MSESAERLRPRPEGRFAGASHLFNLQHALRELREEAHPAQHGHRQVTIFHRPPVTQVLFAFEPGGELPDHGANGLVVIQVLEGHLTVQVADPASAGAEGANAGGEQANELAAGMLLILSPNVRHSVRAAEASAMLLTVHLEKC